MSVVIGKILLGVAILGLLLVLCVAIGYGFDRLFRCRQCSELDALQAGGVGFFALAGLALLILVAFGVGSAFLEVLR